MPRKPPGLCVSERMLRLDKASWFAIAITLNESATALAAALREGRTITGPMTPEVRALSEQRLDLLRNAVAQARDGSFDPEEA